MHHLPDSHLHSYARFRFALTEDRPTIQPYQEALWADLPDARSTAIEVSLDLLDASGAPAIMVGDGHNDLLAAADAGMPVVWAAYGYGGDRVAGLSYDTRIENAAELPAALDRLRKA